jgi:hypothetical protein
MSEVRMCDRCGRVFSLAESGWQTGQITTLAQDADGGEYQVRVSMDSCPDCAVAVKGKRPTLAIAEAERADV